MQQREFMSGFSDLKGLLIRTYKIDKEKEFVKLYFTKKDNELLMHDFSNHNRTIGLCSDIKNKFITVTISPTAKLLVKESLIHIDPAKFLNEQFKLYGFFRF